MVQAVMNITSAAGIISLLDENQTELRVFALKKLDSIVNEFWPEISEAIEKIEVLYEDEAFPQRRLAALVASKVYYHLGSFEDSLTYALGASDLFDVNTPTEYVETTISKSIDHYTKLRLEDESGLSVDPRLEAIVNRMFLRCFNDGQYRQAVGIALETRRMDMFEKAIMTSDDVPGMLAYSSKVAMTLVPNRTFRDEVLRALVKLYKNLTTPDYVNMCQCLIFLDDAQSVADVLIRLVKGSGQESTLMAYQIAFDLYESATQQFLTRVLQALKALAPAPKADKEEAKPVAEPEKADASAEPTKQEGEGAVKKEPQEQPVELSGAPPAQSSTVGDEHAAQVEKLSTILGGEITIGLHLQFLIRSNHTDLLILKQTKEAVRNSVCHTATVIANSLMHSGTTSDQFLRDNLDWLARATNWAKFTATASLGVIHKGHEKEALHLMSSYLPKESGPGSGYTEGGGLYALGLIHANHGAAIIDYLLAQLKDASNEIIRHGGCLGVGLAAMSTHRQDVYEQLKFTLYQDDAVAGEAAGIAMGLVMLGSKSSTALEDMVAYAQETQHEKILRGLAVGIAMVMFGRMEEADALIENLCRDKDPLLRRSAMHTIAMAYCGSGSNKAIRRLLHIAVSDVNDDVRRAAVEALGFILFRTPEQCPSVVSLLSESYNPNVRYGSAMALGISCAGTGNKEALALLEPMTNDPVNYVRQGALVASALILIQQTEATCPKVKDFRQLYHKVVSDKHDDVMAKFGAIIAQGILDAGGRNVSIGLLSRTGHTNLAAVVGMLVFTQFWYWFPLAHFLSLALTPTCLVGLNGELKMPRFSVRSAAKPSTFAYPPPLEEKKEREREKVTTAVLSITAKAKRKEADKKEQKEQATPESMEVDEDNKTKEEAKPTEEAAPPAATLAESAEAETKKEGEDAAAKEKKPEPSFEMLSNPARAVKPQLKVIQMPEGCRYRPIKDITIGGIIMMIDTKSEDVEELVEPVSAGGPTAESDEGEEPEPPEPFEYVDE
ncbi:26S proteasome non-ATPase regulatory subunit 1-like [Ornithodoros turicata]|uniref:26S proteasome non-ATPase regulatory subunit 1-like n=1 Tax=Ornithodoros turicata TaxID=34597 RepID=UPI00313902DA